MLLKILIYGRASVTIVTAIVQKECMHTSRYTEVPSKITRWSEYAVGYNTCAPLVNVRGSDIEVAGEEH